MNKENKERRRTSDEKVIRDNILALRNPSRREAPEKAADRIVKSILEKVSKDAAPKTRK